VAVLREVHRTLRHGGLVLATEPAFARQIDERVMSRRRYQIPEFSAMCAKADFRSASRHTSLVSARGPYR